ncbi:AAA family ATPase [Chloroflexia bacterium SDU3-3]|nr:AAA family ATPase [Chloroflexia bacterium SDU3-3]
MYLHRVILDHIRGFEHLDFTLARPDGSYAGWTVFTGDNGAGKSTLLKAIAMGLTGRDTARALQPNLNQWVRHGSPDEKGSITLEISRVAQDDTFVSTGKTPVSRFSANLLLRNTSRETIIEIPAKRKSLLPSERSIWAVDAPGWFSCGYGPFRRVFGASSEATQLMMAPRTQRFATMFQEAASLQQATQWLRELRYKALEGRRVDQEQLDMLLELFNDSLLPNQLRIDRVDSDGLWLEDRHGIQVVWEDMSDGYRAMLALLTDILRHLIDTYGTQGLFAHDSEGNVIINRSGVVLIDEIDAHLHPEWQREIGFWLKQRFPHIQFLVSTHSPIICQAADPNGLFVLPEPGGDQQPMALSEDDYQKVIASRPDTILLTSAFGLENTRSPRAVQARSDYARLQAKQRAGAKLTADERRDIEQLALFAQTDEEL